ncbi:hypothetical protein BJF85_20390 [Saccharomonospora sp. CUA-673]|nr:hypothetical protein BJF85_20390 [Saccharomonospora sp. CUA-673]
MTAEVGVRGLPGDRRIAPDAEQIVGVLERAAAQAAVLAQAVEVVRAGVAEHAARGGGALEQRAGLVIGHGETFGDVHIGALFEAHIGELPLDEAADGPADQFRHLGRPRMAADGDQLQRPGQQGVTGEDRRSGPERHPRGRPMPTGRVAVHDIVVQQREVVHEFDRDRRGQSGVRTAADRAGGEQCERGPQRLATVGVLRPAVTIPPAEVVTRDGPDRRGQRVHRVPQFRCDAGPTAFENRHGGVCVGALRPRRQFGCSLVDAYRPS